MKKILLFALLFSLCFILVSCIQIYMPETALPAQTQTPAAEVEAPEQTPEQTPTPEPADLSNIRPGMYEVLLPEIDDPFTDEDWKIDGFEYDCDKSGLLLTYGEYESTRSEVWGATGDTHEYYEYTFGELEFVNGQFGGAEIYTDAVAGPRDIRVGMRVDDVIKMFHTGIEKQSDEMIIFYRNNPGRDNWMLLPPYGIMTQDSALMLVYTWYDTDNYDLHETLDATEESAVFLNKLTFSMEINDEGIVTGLYLSSGADAE